MNWTNILLILISSLLSGLIGVTISNRYYQKNETRRLKLKIFQQLLGNRHDLRGQLFTEALNQVFVIFNDSKDVLIALKEFHDIISDRPKDTTIANKKLLELFKAMSKNLKINIAPLTDNFFLQAFNIK